MAGAAFSKGKDTATATTIMVTGIIFQLASTVVFVTLMESVLFRGLSTLQANRPLLKLAAATMLSVTCMVIRGIYRSMELLQGWRGYLITNERFCIALEGLLMAVAVIIFNFYHPGRLLREAREAEKGRRRGSGGFLEFDGLGKKSGGKENREREGEGERRTIEIDVDDRRGL